MATIGDPLMDLGNSSGLLGTGRRQAPFKMLRRQPTHRRMLTRDEVVTYLRSTSGADRYFDFLRGYGLFVWRDCQAIYPGYVPWPRTETTLAMFGQAQLFTNAAVKKLISRAAYNGKIYRCATASQLWCEDYVAFAIGWQQGGCLGRALKCSQRTGKPLAVFGGTLRRIEKP